MVKEKNLKFHLGKNDELMIRIKKETTNKIETIPFEEYIVGVLAGEMPTSFELEALKAQAVAARSYALKKMMNNNGEYDVVDTVSNQVYYNEEQLKAKWQNDYENRIKKVKQAVKETENEYLDYNGEVVQAFFFQLVLVKPKIVKKFFKMPCHI